MKAVTKKSAVFFSLLLLMTGIQYVYAAKLVIPLYPPTQKLDCVAQVANPKRKPFVHGYCRMYNVPADICFFIRCLLYDNPFKYRNKPLPNDLAGQDLSGFDFTGCQFTHTKLTGSNLDEVTLTNTTCDYQKAFQDNIKENRIEGGTWYQDNLPQDLKSIAEVYPRLKNNTHKAKLLHIACGLSRLPFYEGMAFYIKVEYWSSALLQLKQALNYPYAHELACSLELELNEDADDFCWTTNYPQNRVDIATRALHANFDTYLNDFNIRVIEYNCISNCELCWYKEEIVLSIKGLQKTYPNIKDKQLQQETCDIAYALSKSYQVQRSALQHHYLLCQYRIIQLENSVEAGVKHNIHHNHSLDGLFSKCGWHKG